jgi:hypothetical protein
MKKILLLGILLFVGILGFSQVLADPALNQINITDNANVDVNEFELPQGGVVVLRVPLLNLNTTNALPSGSCKVKIGLGSKLVLDPGFDLNTTNTSSFFNWTAETVGGQVQLTGDLKADLPAGYDVTTFFNVRGSVLGNSTVTTNFLVTNHNSILNLSDENPANNTSFLPYTVVAVIPVNFTGITARQEDCNVNVNFTAEGEINVGRYEIQVSQNGTQYTTVGQLAANNRINYRFSFPITDAIKAPLLYIRVKSVDLDGRTQYTEVRTVNGSCEADKTILLFPNPISQNQQTLTVRATNGSFRGNVNVTLLDVAGRILRTQALVLNNQQQFEYKTGILAAGQYMLKLTEGNNTQPIVLRFQKK